MSPSRRKQIRSYIIAAVLFLIVAIQFRFNWFAAFPFVGIYGVAFLANVLFSYFVWALYFLANVAVGFHFRLFAWWPLKIAREQDGIRFRRNDTAFRFNLLMLPSTIHNLRRRLIFLFLISPGAGLLTILGAGFALYRFVQSLIFFPSRSGTIVLLVAPRIPFFDTFLTGMFLAYFILIGFGYVAGAVRKRGIKDPTAPDRITMLRQDGPLGDRYCAVIALSGCSYDGQRPRDWDPVMLRHALALQDGSQDEVAGSLFAYYVALDCGASDEAATHLDRLLELRDTSLAIYAAVIACEAVYFAAWHRSDAVAAREYLAKVPAKPWIRQLRMRAEAATLLAEGRREEAWMLATEAMVALGRANNLGHAHAEHDWLSAIMARAAGIAPQTQPGAVPI